MCLTLKLLFVTFDDFLVLSVFTNVTAAMLVSLTIYKVS